MAAAIKRGVLHVCSASLPPGPAVPAEGDPWPVLATPARAALLIAAAQAVRADATEVSRTLVDACGRLA